MAPVRLQHPLDRAREPVERCLGVVDGQSAGRLEWRGEAIGVVGSRPCSGFSAPLRRSIRHLHMADSASVPVTLVTGFLGAGKTTLVNRILSERHGERIAVIVNEFGDVGIDGRLVQGVEEDVVELSNGCLCCTIRGDLETTVTELLDRRNRRFFRKLHFDRLLIETSGLASPGPVLQTFEVVPRLKERAHVDGTLTLVHAHEIARQIPEHPEAAEQIGFADRVVLNHTDRCDENQLVAAESAVRAVNETCTILHAKQAQVEIAPLLEVGSTGPTWTRPATEHAHTVGAGTLSFHASVPLDLHRLKMWLRFVTERRTHDLWRLKGIAHCRGIDTVVVAQGIQQWLEVGPGNESPPEESVLVLIGRGLDREELDRAWRELAMG